MDDSRARQLLEAERARLQEIERTTRSALEDSQRESSSELSTFDQHPGDLATDTHERERDHSVLESVHAQLADVDRALRKLDEGRYGICEATGDRIPDERLEALPGARYTVEAQARLERGERAGTARSDPVSRPEAAGDEGPAEELPPAANTATAASGAGATAATPAGDAHPGQDGGDLMDEQKRLREKAFATYNVTGCYPDMEAARHAVEQLERSGVAASSISLLGPGAEEASETADTAQRDERTMDKALKATLGGAAAGSGVGGVVGFLAGAAAFGIPGVGPAVGAGIWAATIGGAAAGGGVGFTAGAMTQMKQSEAWETTLQEVQEGYVVVGAHTEDRDEFEKANDALEGSGAQRLRSFDADGKRLEA